MNVPMMRAVQNHILEHPDLFSMDSWLSGGPASGENCKACIGGRAVLLQHDGVQAGSIGASGACEALGLTERQGGILFYVNRWPEPYAEDYQRVPSGNVMERADIAYRMIGDFIVRYENAPAETAVEERMYTDDFEFADGLCACV